MELESKVAKVSFHEDEEIRYFMKNRLKKVSDLLSIKTSSTADLSIKTKNKDDDRELGHEKNGTGKKKERKSKKELIGRTFFCEICNKSYLSYPALYTHKRNKHNIIPITGKPEFFKNSKFETKAKFKYNNHVTHQDLRNGLVSIIENYKKLSEEVYLNKESCFYKEAGYDYQNDIFLKELSIFIGMDLHSITVPKPEMNFKIDTILIIYVLLLIKVKADNDFFNILSKFLFWFREYLNMIGWDYLEGLKQYGIDHKLCVSQIFSTVNNCEEVPELLNDFISVFLEIESCLTNEEKNQISDLAENFCYWLLINDLTPYKVFKLES